MRSCAPARPHAPDWATAQARLRRPRWGPASQSGRAAGGASGRGSKRPGLVRDAALAESGADTGYGEMLGDAYAAPPVRQPVCPVSCCVDHARNRAAAWTPRAHQRGRDKHCGLASFWAVRSPEPRRARPLHRPVEHGVKPEQRGGEHVTHTPVSGHRSARDASSSCRCGSRGGPMPSRWSATRRG
jgi:hypothetical protein